MHASMAHGVLPITSDCASCQHLIDVRCRYFRAHAFYHRIYECLLPLYGAMVEQLQEIPARSTGQVCLLGEKEVIYPYLVALGAEGDALDSCA
ncbi:hypothetical protein AB1Y20_001777 [Prymnesium parvum]|uniref:Uncharacterized protein n=1 Tax=Prymnesium parvum TaxID=97485 RepID=A0AB34KAG0_PRYPA